MKRKLCISLLFMLSLLQVYSQEVKPTFGIKFSGFVKTDIFYDTRQSSASNGIREGHFYLFPDNASFDSEGNDINANPSFHMLSIQSRLKGDISGPDAFGAKTSGLIESEFFGTSESDLNGFRLRHAYLKMEWLKTVLLVGQYWHPMFPAESFPGTVSFNTGAPFTPFSRNPQLRVTRKLGDFSLSLTAYSQRDFTSPGPDGNSNKYLRNSGLPGFNIQMKLAGGNLFTASAGFDHKTLRPEIKTSRNAETDATISSYSLFGTLRIKTDPVTVSLMGVYGQNAADLVMIGGYAISEVTDTAKNLKTYTNLNTANFWADVSTNGKKLSLGLFTGYSKNLGAERPFTGTVFGRGNDIDHLFRISPRITLTEGSLTFAAEVENTLAAYGTMKFDGLVSDTKNVNNVRILLSAIYRF